MSTEIMPACDRAIGRSADTGKSSGIGGDAFAQRDVTPDH